MSWPKHASLRDTGYHINVVKDKAAQSGLSYQGSLKDLLSPPIPQAWGYMRQLNIMWNNAKLHTPYRQQAVGR